MISVSRGVGDGPLVCARASGIAVAEHSLSAMGSILVHPHSRKHKDTRPAYKSKQRAIVAAVLSSKAEFVFRHGRLGCGERLARPGLSRETKPRSLSRSQSNLTLFFEKEEAVNV